MTEPIPLVDIAAQQREVAREVQPEVERILATGAFIGGADVDRFEASYAAYIGTEHCVGVANGTDALELALRAAGVGPGDEVILPANTFIATAEAVVRAGATPVLVDCDDDDLLIDPERVPPRSRADPGGHPGPPLRPDSPGGAHRKAVDGTSIVIVEDAAQSQGARRNGTAAGAPALAAATSFYPGKNLGAYGDAGAVVTNDAELARTARLLRNHGSERKYDHEVIGFNSRLDTLQAVVLSRQAGRLDAWNEARRQAAARYDALLADLDGCACPRSCRATSTSGTSTWCESPTGCGAARPARARHRRRDPLPGTRPPDAGLLGPASRLPGDRACRGRDPVPPALPAYLGSPAGASRRHAQGSARPAVSVQPGAVVPEQGLGHRVGRGLGWSFLNNVVSRLGTRPSGIVLARLLAPADFGVFAVALVVLDAGLSMNELGVAWRSSAGRKASSGSPPRSRPWRSGGAFSFTGSATSPRPCSRRPSTPLVLRRSSGFSAWPSSSTPLPACVPHSLRGTSCSERGWPSTRSASPSAQRSRSSSP